MVDPPPVEQPPTDRALAKRPSGDRPQEEEEEEEEEEERQLVRCKKQKEEAPPARADSGALTLEAPIAATPLSERQPRPSYDTSREFAIADAETPRGKPFFGCNPTKVERVLRDSPGCPPMVVDFLAGRAPRGPVDVPSCINRAIANLPQAWTTDLDEVATRRGNDMTQALALQTATMAATVARESELRPSVPKLKTELEESRKRNGELCYRVAKMKKDSLESAKRASLQVDQLVQANDCLKGKLIEAKESYVAMLKEFSGELSLSKGLAETARMEAARAIERAVDKSG
ncbi:hypothetical protein OROHE_007373 [Orobanche hederae]